jgi:hypothetical protein
MGKNQDPRYGINIPNPQHWLETDKQGGVGQGKLKREIEECIGGLASLTIFWVKSYIIL